MNDPTEYLPGTEEQAEPETTTTLPAVIAPVATPLAARDAGIAAYLASAYSKAGTLKLTPEEGKALKADFGDECFITGAAGKSDLIYIESHHLRNRMDEVLGMGNWSTVAIRTWTETYKAEKGDAVCVYHEVILIVRGVYICQAVGDMTYYTANHAMNYGDAFEGSQSHALRRCLKGFGVGLQAFSKTFQRGWFERQRHKPTAPPAPPPAPKSKSKEPLKIATANTRARVLEVLGAIEPGAPRTNLTNFLRAAGWLDADKEVEQWPARFVPITADELKDLQVALGSYSLNADTPGYKIAHPYQPHGIDPGTLNATPVKEVKPAEVNGWRAYIIPFKPHKGVALGKVDPKELQEFWANFTVRESVTGPEGEEVPYPAEIVNNQKAFRAALDLAGKELGFKEVE